MYCSHPAYSQVLPKDVDISTKLLLRHITLNIPSCCAAMDTVTEAQLAIAALAREGGRYFT
ncbi:MAG: IMP dehydrogenase [Chitinophagaceae bacterium]|nr:IMP dehydrogenase [Chitinophagaceae bacterium]